MRHYFKTIICLSVLSWFFAGQALAAGQVDNRMYASLLKEHVSKSRVNYDGFKKDEPVLDDYLALLGDIDVKSLSKNDLFAFYINAYNAFTIKLILTKYPKINSIKEVGSFFSNPWNKEFISLKGKTVSLDYIEHKILRPQFKDPRVHFAINCASRSCPQLRNEPFEGDTLENQLDDQARIFINDTKHNFIKDNTFYISKIFKWFKEDFSDNPLMFIRRYASRDLTLRLNTPGQEIKISYLDYDWSLNR